MRNDLSLWVERVNLRTILYSLLVAALGIVLIVLSPIADERGYHKLGAIGKEGGSALVISVALAALWDLAGKRAFADEILAKANMSRDLADAGLEIITPSFKDDRISWQDLFKNACRLDLFVSYAHTWRNTQTERIEKLLADPAAKLRVVLPDLGDESVVTILSSRYEMQPEIFKLEISSAIEFYERKAKKAKGTIEIYLTAIIPVFSFYRFNNKIVFALYNHKSGQQPVPSFVCNNEGFLAAFFVDEFEGIIGDTRRTKRIYPVATEGQDAASRH